MGGREEEEEERDGREESVAQQGRVRACVCEYPPHGVRQVEQPMRLLAEARDDGGRLVDVLVRIFRQQVRDADEEQPVAAHLEELEVGVRRQRALAHALQLMLHVVV